MNHRRSWIVALLLVALVAVRAPAQDKDKKDPPKKDEVKKDEPKKEDKKPATPAPAPMPEPKPKTAVILGELIHVESGKAGFRVRTAQPYVDIDRGAARAFEEEKANYKAALAAKNYAKAREYYAEMLKHQAAMKPTPKNNKEYTLEAHEKAVVRLPGPKESFDEMGNVKKYTAKELDALRGRDKLFPGEFSDLTVGQIVRVTIIVPKAPTKPLKKDDLLLEEPKIEATRVEVLRQPKVGK